MARPDPDLRRIVACPDCTLQYDAIGYEAGDRFHCACGNVVTVGAEQPHDAAVVRCSSCGSPRRKGSAACDFCSADFTLHERDLHTICPGCMSRISDRAAYCHACGLAISPQGPVGSLSGKQCPVCGVGHELNLRNVEEGTVTVLECDHCAGVWIGHRIFGLLERRAKQDVDLWSEPSAPNPGRKAEQTGTSFYRACVECGKLMNRRNYGHRSGVIVDVCREHGLWFDLGELEDILAWVRGGGLEGARTRTLAAASEESVSIPISPSPSRPGDPGTWSGFVAYLVEALIEFLADRGPRR